MKLACEKFGLCFSWQEGSVYVLTIENKAMRFSVVWDLFTQCQGQEGEFVLSDSDKLIKPSKLMDLLPDPFSVQLNSKKMLTKLYREMSDYGNESFYAEKEEINRLVVELFDKLTQNTLYSVTSNLDLDISDLCKIYNVQLEPSGDTLTEKLMDYMRSMNQLCGCTVFVLINFEMYLDRRAWEALYEFVMYQKIYLLRIEFARPEKIGGEKGCIIDEDCCIIEV